MWTAYIFVPIQLDDADYRRLRNGKKWQSWQSRLSHDDRRALPDRSQFFIQNARNWYLPVDDEIETCPRWTFPVGTQAETPVMGDDSDNRLIQVQWVDMIRFPEQAMLIIQVTSCSKQLTPEQVMKFSRYMSEWTPFHEHHQVTPWRVNGRDIKGLRSWVLDDVLGLSSKDISAENSAKSQWFGSTVPVLIMNHFEDIPNWESEEIALLIERVCLGIENDDEQHRPSKIMKQKIQAQYIQEWDNWRIHEWRNKMFLLYGGAKIGGQPANTERYYVPMIASVLYQRVMISHYLDRFMNDSEEHSKLRESFKEFRRNFVAHRISSYPLGNELYRFLREVNDIPETFQDVEDEIQAADQLDRLKLERKENILIRSLTAFAAFFVPVSAISSIYGGSSKNIEELDPWFWWISGGVTAAALVSVFLWWKWLDHKIKTGKLD